MKTIKLFLLFALNILIISSCTAKKSEYLMVKFKTTKGTIVLKLYPETVKHRDNFLKLVDSGMYDGVLFHRVIDNFMIQAGDPDSKKASHDAELGSGDVGYSIPAEFIYPKYYHKKGALAAAREGDDVNPQKASSGCQFYVVEGKVFTNNDLDALEKKLNKMFTEQQRRDYISIGGTPHLDGNYTVFGEVVKGMDIVEKISKVKTSEADRPIEDVKILKAKRIE